jgi:hypothetical protein
LKKGEFAFKASRLLIFFSFVSILLSFWGFAYKDIILASTQWLLVALVLAVFSLYTRLEANK